MGVEQNEDAALVTRFIERIEIEPIPNSQLVDVSFMAKDPILAADIINPLIKAYIDQNREERLAATKDAIH